MCDMTRSYVRHGSFKRSLLHTSDMTRSHVRHDSFKVSLIHTCDMTHSHVHHHSFKSSLIHTCGMTRSYVRHDSFKITHVDDIGERRPRSVSLMESEKPAVEEEAAEEEEEGEEEFGAAGATFHRLLPQGLTRRSRRSLSLAEPLCELRAGHLGSPLEADEDADGAEQDPAVAAACAVAAVEAEEMQRGKGVGSVSALDASSKRHRMVRGGIGSGKHQRPRSDSMGSNGAASERALLDSVDSVKGNWVNGPPPAGQAVVQRRKNKGKHSSFTPTAASVVSPQLRHDKEAIGDGGSGKFGGVGGQPHPRMLAEFIEGVQGRSNTARWNTPQSHIMAMHLNEVVAAALSTPPGSPARVRHVNLPHSPAAAHHVLSPAGVGASTVPTAAAAPVHAHTNTPAGSADKAHRALVFSQSSDDIIASPDNTTASTVAAAVAAKPTPTAAAAGV